MLPDRSTAPAPDLVSVPVPEMLLEKVLLSLRLRTSEPLLTIWLLGSSDPVVPPLPIDNPPASILVTPV